MQTKSKASGKAREVRQGGATGQRIRVRDRLRGYFLNHQQVCLLTLKRLVSEPVQSLMTSLVIAIALGLPAALYVGVINLQQIGNGFDDTARLTVFLQRNARPEAIDKLRQQLEKDTDVAGVVYISRQQALAEFKAASGFGEVLSMLNENPLPPVLLIEPAAVFQADLPAA